MVPTVKVFVVENREEKYRKSFKFFKQAKKAMEKHGAEKCKIVYLANGEWNVGGYLDMAGKLTRAQ